MRVLLTNDDGIHAAGLLALYRRFAPRYEVTVVAPDRERSAVSHAITLNDPLRAVKITLNGGFSGFAVNGTPADCVKLGVLEILRQRPDLVISGINAGANVGVNLNYSGTVAAAKEAALYGLPAIAVSMQNRESRHFDMAAGFVESLASTVLERGLPAGTLLNVNLPEVPLSQAAGIRVSRQGSGIPPEFFERRLDPRNRPYYWQGGTDPSPAAGTEVDEGALMEKFVTITPIKCDMTDYGLLDELSDWFVKGPPIA